MKRNKAGIFGAALIAGTLAFHGYASTNTVTHQEARSMAGLGAGVVLRLEVTNTEYIFDSTDKTQITGITFTIDKPVAAEGDAVAYMQPNGGISWTSCGAVANGATQITCSYSSSIFDIGKDSNGDEQPLRFVIAE